MTDQAASAGMIVITGAITNNALFALAGTIISFNSSLSASAIGCNKPAGPTRFGPIRTCIQPIILRSHSVRYATQPIKGKVTAMILINVHAIGQAGPRS